MASWLPNGGQSVNGYVLAVDSSRFAVVADPARGGPSSAQIAASLAVSAVPKLTVTGTALHVVLTTTGREAINRAAPEHARTVRELVFDALSDQELDTLARFTSKVLDRLQSGRSPKT